MPLSPTGVPSRSGIQAAIDEARAEAVSDVVGGAIQRGSVNLVLGSAAASGTVSITFPTPYSSPPVVVVSRVSGAWLKAFAEVAAVTSSGATFRLSTGDGTNIGAGSHPLNWIAIQA